jgi:hypothetical protein
MTFSPQQEILMTVVVILKIRQYIVCDYIGLYRQQMETDRYSDQTDIQTSEFSL